jgi:hypothetical protein
MVSAPLHAPPCRYLVHGPAGWCPDPAWPRSSSSPVCFDCHLHGQLSNGQASPHRRSPPKVALGALDSRTFVLYNGAVRLTAQGRRQMTNLSPCLPHWAHLPRWRIGMEGIRSDLFRETIASGGIWASEHHLCLRHGAGKRARWWVPTPPSPMSLPRGSKPSHHGACRAP